MSLFFSPSLCSVLRARKTNRNDSFIYKCLLTKKEKERNEKRKMRGVDTVTREPALQVVDSLHMGAGN